MPTDLALIRFVTRRYRELQGLHLFAWSLCGAVYLSLTLFWVGDDPAAQSILAALTLCLPMALAGAGVRHFYETRFGRLADDAAFPWACVVLFATGFIAVAWLAPAPVLVSSVLAGGVAVHLGITLRDFPFRSHHLLGAAGGLLALSISWSAGAHERGLAFLVWNVSLIAVGLLDHLLLVRAMPGCLAAPLPSGLDAETVQGSHPNDSPGRADQLQVMPER